MHHKRPFHILRLLTNNPSMTVEIPPPINPSHVFLGDNFINGVLPKKNPKTYAITSFITIILTGTMNLIKVKILKLICIT